jgi:hypothetical protein
MLLVSSAASDASRWPTAVLDMPGRLRMSRVFEQSERDGACQVRLGGAPSRGEALRRNRNDAAEGGSMPLVSSAASDASR